MPPRAFPFPFKVGVDVCRIQRIRDLFDRDVARDVSIGKRKPLARFLSKLMTWPERQYFWERFRDYDTVNKDLTRVSEFIAGRWAAKEACRKACPHLGKSNGFHNIMILPISREKGTSQDITAAPTGLILREMIPAYPPERAEVPGPNGGGSTRVGGPRSVFDIEAVEGQFCEISISHENELAIAVALVPSVPADWAVKTQSEAEGIFSRMGMSKTVGAGKEGNELAIPSPSENHKLSKAEETEDDSPN